MATLSRPGHGVRGNKMAFNLPGLRELKAWSRRSAAPVLERNQWIPPRTQHTPDPKPPNKDGIVRLIRQSGYPLEVDLFHVLHQRGADPTHSFVLRSPEIAEARELDVIGRFHVQHQYQEGNLLPTARLDLMLMIEAKNWAPHRVFVGFVGNELTPHEMLIRRTRISGTPTFNVTPEGGTVHGFVLAFGEALSPLNDAPLCMQWGSTGEKGVLEHDDQTFKGIQTAVTAAVLLGRDHCAFLTTGRDPTVRMEILQPVLVVDTPKLYLFDVRSDKLTETDRLMIEVSVELPSGPSYRLVDVVTRKGFERYLDACERCMANLQPVLEREIYDVALAHAANVFNAREKAAERALEQTDRGRPGSVNKR
jgi:hypothetical protein